MQSERVAVQDDSQVGEARRAAQGLAGRLGLTAQDAARVALVATEAANNLVRHGGGGELVLRGLEARGRAGVELLALDRGPGMADVDACLRDGFSTAGTAGEGLGAIRRQAGVFDLYAPAGLGTALVAQVWSGGREAPAGEAQLGAVCLPLSGEDACGDAWWWEEQDGRGALLVADGLGHGPQAAEAALAAVRVLREAPLRAPREQLERMHAALRATRGAAVAVAQVDRRGGALLYAGSGNVSGAVLLGPQRQGLVSHNGTVGVAMRTVQELPYVLPEGALLVLHTDGLATSWRMERYPGLLARHPALVAGVLYRDFSRGRDDVTVVALRGGGA